MQLDDEKLNPSNKCMPCLFPDEMQGHYEERGHGSVCTGMEARVCDFQHARTSLPASSLSPSHAMIALIRQRSMHRACPPSLPCILSMRHACIRRLPHRLDLFGRCVLQSSPVCSSQLAFPSIWWGSLPPPLPLALPVACPANPQKNTTFDTSPASMLFSMQFAYFMPFATFFLGTGRFASVVGIVASCIPQDVLAAAALIL